MGQPDLDPQPGERPEPVEQARGQGLDAAADEGEPRDPAQPGEVAGRDRGQPSTVSVPVSAAKCVSVTCEQLLTLLSFDATAATMA